MLPPMRVRTGTTFGLSTVANTDFSSAIWPGKTVNVDCARAAAVTVALIRIKSGATPAVGLDRATLLTAG